MSADTTAKAAAALGGGRGLRSISTSSYAQWTPAMGTPVRTSLGRPAWTPPGRRYWLYVAELAPKPWYWRAEPDVYRRHYQAQMARLGGDALAKLAAIVSQHGDVCLLCFCRPGEFCHRRLAAEYISQALGGLEIPELTRREVNR